MPRSVARRHAGRLCGQSAVMSAMLSLGLVTVTATAVSADNWQLLDASADGQYLSLETETIEKNGEAIQFWTAIEQTATADFPDGLTLETRYSASCDSKVYRSERTLAYTGTGEVLYSNDRAGELKTAEPGTRIYNTIDVACAYGESQAAEE
ncbi:MAG: surface-adhesin E family protein [Cyanobacteria bacterium J06632_22]